MNQLPPRPSTWAAKQAEQRHFVRGVEGRLRTQRFLRFHVALIAMLCLGVAMVLGAALLKAGLTSLVIRWPLVLLLTYGFYLLLLHVWSRYLLSQEEEALQDPGLDAFVSRSDGSASTSAEPPFSSGGGGDFGGGGASGDWSMGEVVGQAAEGLGSADEGIVVVIPVLAIVGLATLLASAMGLVVFGLFGVEVLLAVCIELALAASGGALAYKAQREAWLATAFKRTWMPMAVLLVAAFVLGWWVPTVWPEVNGVRSALGLILAR